MSKSLTDGMPPTKTAEGGGLRQWDPSIDAWITVPLPPSHDKRMRRLEEIEDRVARLTILHSQDNEARYYGATLPAMITALYWVCDPSCTWAEAGELAQSMMVEILRGEGL